MIMKSFRPFRVVQFASSDNWMGSDYLSGSWFDESYRMSRSLCKLYSRYTSQVIIRDGRFAYRSCTHQIRQGGPYSLMEINRSEDGGAHRQFKGWSSNAWAGPAISKLL